MGEFSPSHWILTFGIFLLFFGPSKLPAFGESLGKTIRNFKKSLNDIHDQPEAGQSTPEKVTKKIEE